MAVPVQGADGDDRLDLESGWTWVQILPAVQTPYPEDNGGRHFVPLQRKEMNAENSIGLESNLHRINYPGSEAQIFSMGGRNLLCRQQNNKGDSWEHFP